MNHKVINKDFNKELHKVSICSLILKIVPIPIGIITAKLMAKIVQYATDGKVNNVLITALVYLGIILTVTLLFAFADILYEKSVSKALHRCKMILYNRFLSNPLHILYITKHGETIERFNDDFTTITDRRLVLYPTLITGSLTAIAYFIYLCIYSIPIAITLLTISIVQIIPPIVIKKYMQLNYDNTRDIEAKLTNIIMESYRGFATIKLYSLKRWYLDRIKKLHQKYYKIGNKSEITMTSQIMMESFLSNILKYGTYGIIGVLVLFDYSDMNTGVQAIALSGAFFAAINSIFNCITEYSVSKVAEQRLDSIFVENSKDIVEYELNNTSIALTNVMYRKEEREILSEASVQFDLDNISIIRGENGIGKTTIFRLITGLDTCDKGAVTIGDICTDNISEKEFYKNIFYLPQVDPKFSFTPIEMYSMVIPDRIADAIKTCNEFGIEESVINNTRIDKLSGGESKKVYLVLALLLDVPILLLDEPTNSLDEKAKNILVDKIMKRKYGAIIITHDKIFDDIVHDSYVIEGGGVRVG